MKSESGCVTHLYAQVSDLFFVVAVWIEDMFKYFIIIVRLFMAFLESLVHWCAYESCFVVLVQV